MRTIVYFSLIWLATAVSVPAEDSWTGLWRVNRYYQERLDGTYHLFIKQGEDGGLSLTAYTDDARPMIPQSLKTSGGRLEVQVANSVKQPLPLLFILTREGDQVTGEWQFSQMQLSTPVTGEVVGFRITTSADWTPWPFLPDLQASDKTSIDLAGLLLRDAPRKSFDKFIEFWDREIESRYYFLVQQPIYGAARSRNRRNELIKPLFEQLQQPESRKLLEQFPKIAKRIEGVIETRDAKGTKTYLVSFPVLPQGEGFRELALWTRIPTPIEEASCACTLDLRERFLLTSGLHFAEPKELAEPSWEESILNQVLWQLPAPTLGVALFRKSLARVLAFKGRELPVTTVDPEKHKELKNKVGEILMTPLPASAAEVNRKTTELMDLGVEFVRHLEQETSLREVLRHTDLDVVRDWQRFLGKPVTPVRRRR